MKSILDVSSQQAPPSLKPVSVGVVAIVALTAAGGRATSPIQRATRGSRRAEPPALPPPTGGGPSVVLGLVTGRTTSRSLPCREGGPSAPGPRGRVRPLWP